MPKDSAARRLEQFTQALRILSVPFALAGLTHLILGVQAELLLGAQLPVAALEDPVLDSQNRFYGAAFMLYGFLLYLCARDIWRFLPVFNCVIWTFFLAGVARLPSLISHGVPTAPVLVLLISELMLPPLLAGWLISIRRPLAAKSGLV